MKLSELIELLKQRREDFGDLDVEVAVEDYDDYTHSAKITDCTPVEYGTCGRKFIIKGREGR